VLFKKAIMDEKSGEIYLIRMTKTRASKALRSPKIIRMMMSPLKMKTITSILMTLIYTIWSP
jgi:hypothetical protein